MGLHLQSAFVGLRRTTRAWTHREPMSAGDFAAAAAIALLRGSHSSRLDPLRANRERAHIGCQEGARLGHGSSRAED